MDDKQKNTTKGEEGTASSMDEEESDGDESEVDEGSIDGTGSYLDNYDDDLKVDKPRNIPYEKLLKNYKGNEKSDFPQKLFTFGF